MIKGTISRAAAGSSAGTKEQKKGLLRTDQQFTFFFLSHRKSEYTSRRRGSRARGDGDGVYVHSGRLDTTFVGIKRSHLAPPNPRRYNTRFITLFRIGRERRTLE